MVDMCVTRTEKKLVLAFRALKNDPIPVKPCREYITGTDRKRVLNARTEARTLRIKEHRGCERTTKSVELLKKNMLAKIKKNRLERSWGYILDKDSMYMTSLMYERILKAVGKTNKEEGKQAIAEALEMAEQTVLRWYQSAYGLKPLLRVHYKTFKKIQRFINNTIKESRHERTK